MNPYLRQDDVWEDIHGRFLPIAAEFTNGNSICRRVILSAIDWLRGGLSALHRGRQPEAALAGS